ncbi:hypothetical protein Acsp02_92820 [Actinoplanes sp. NBRC 103695]|nr:hypothetical protein Acsp02_92820 [Actinoplanes sp. NBRC 103695]
MSTARDVGSDAVTTASVGVGGVVSATVLHSVSFPAAPAGAGYIWQTAHQRVVGRARMRSAAMMHPHC